MGSVHGSLTCNNEEHACAWLALHDNDVATLHSALLQHKVQLSQIAGVAALKDGHLPQKRQLLSSRCQLQTSMHPTCQLTLFKDCLSELKVQKHLSPYSSAT